MADINSHNACVMRRWLIDGDAPIGALSQPVVSRPAPLATPRATTFTENVVQLFPARSR